MIHKLKAIITCKLAYVCDYGLQRGSTRGQNETVVAWEPECRQDYESARREVIRMNRRGTYGSPQVRMYGRIVENTKCCTIRAYLINTYFYRSVNK